MPRSAQVIRFMALLRELESAAGLYVPAMAKRLNVTRRTIYRDIEAIEESGYPVYQDKADCRAVWRFTENYRSSVKELSISSPEMLALWSALSLLRNFEGTPFEKELLNLIRKIESLNNNGNGLRKLGKTLYLRLPVGTKDYSAHGKIIRDLLKAILESRVCTLDYYSFHSEKKKRLEVHPYHLSEYRKGLYLICFSPAHGKVILLAIERMSNLALQTAEFKPDESIDFDDMFDSAFGIVSGKKERVELVFDRKVAKYIKERRWHRSQRVEAMRDGSLKLSLNVCVGFELIHWISGFGPFVKVVKPHGLKAEIAERHKSASDQYR